MAEGHRVLIVEDERTLRRSLASFFRSKGLVVTEVGSIGEAHQELALGRFDAVLLDVGLPDGDGLTLLQESGAERSLVMTANPDPQRFAASGVRHHLAKPLDLGQLLSVVQALAEA